MRKGIILTAVIGLFVFDSGMSQAAGKGQKPEGRQSCDVLRGATSGLYGLCVSYCSVRDQSNVDLNEIASVKAAAPSIELLRKYNNKRRAGDPEMPCFKNTGPTDGDSGGSDDTGDDTGGDDGSTGGDPPPAPPAQCPCWTGEELASLDGMLPTSSLGNPVVDCTAIEENGLAYKRQVVEGYDMGFLTTVEGVAWASSDSGGAEPYNGCFFSNSAGSLNLPIERADAESCVQEVASHCAELGSP